MTDLNNDLPITQAAQPLDLTDLVTLTANNKPIKKHNQLYVTPKRIVEGPEEDESNIDVALGQSNLAMELVKPASMLQQDRN